jgi:adenosyl cobinamide kinase/adenosyl cobinamide phosphate guanylyltransferase
LYLDDYEVVWGKRANQQLAQAADHVYFLVAGLPMRVKGKTYD